MQLLSRSQFEQLSQSASDYSVSIYLPTHVAGPEIQQDPIRLKNLLTEAESRLLAAGMSKHDIGPMLKPVYGLLGDERFWRYQSRGLAIFLTADSARMYRLPLSFESLVVVTNRFHLKPLLPLFFENRYFYILALSQNQVRFFQATRYDISEVSLDSVPTSLAAALKYDDPEKQQQFHNVSGDGSVPMYHGHGVGTSMDDKDDIRRFLAKVESGLQPYLQDDNIPLVLASVEYLQPIYRELNTYPHLVGEGVHGNPDVAKPDELRQQTWPKVAALIEASHQDAVTQYHNMKGTGKASDQIDQLIRAACRGQVETFFTVANAHRWGQVETQTGQVDFHDQPQPRDCDLLDVAAVQTFRQGGTVYILDEDQMPTDAAAAAVYRYGVPAEV
jgi:hypothetical protein